ncbi:glycoside hydrolase superfamily [Aspergillus insuetus]
MLTLYLPSLTLIQQGVRSNCEQPRPSVSVTNPRKIVIEYYEGWNLNKPCGTMQPEEIPIYLLTHVFFSFAFIAPETYMLENMKDFQASLFGRVTNLKTKNPDLKVYPKRAWFMNQYGFDGADIDWEYPGADNRKGAPEDGANFTLLLQEMRRPSQGRYLLTFTAPTSYWYMRHFDIKRSAAAVDWVNLMSYDLHGVLDRENPIENRVPTYSGGMMTFELEDTACWEPGCPFSGPGEEGECTKTSGFLSYKEVKDIIRTTSAKPFFDSNAAVNYLPYGQRSWISYDDAKTVGMKVQFAAKCGLLGVMTWAIDLDDEKGDLVHRLAGIIMDTIQAIKDAISTRPPAAAACTFRTDTGPFRT